MRTVRLGIAGALALRCMWLGLLTVALTASAQSTVPVVMLSDLHFDPFDDPGKVPQLIAAPVERWESILSEPASPTRDAGFAAVHAQCKGHPLDSPYALVRSSLAAAQLESVGAGFVMVSGDLLVHDFQCRYRAALQAPDNDIAGAAASFAARTEVYVMQRIEATFPGLPVYFAPGNNDVGCGNNRLDIRDPFLAATAKTAIAGLRGVSGRQRRRARKTYAIGGYYSLTMAAPMRHTRLLVLDDLYMVDLEYYSTCSGAKNTDGATAEFAWLTHELDTARRRGERVWVLGHIPPGIDTYGTFSNKTDVCKAGEAKLFLGSDELGAVLKRYADVVQLAVFAHSHMDEFRLLRSETGATIPIKMVASVSPVDGNLPSFTVGQVDPTAARLADYAVYAASNKSGIGTTWTQEYSFGKTYHATAFSAETVAGLIGKFQADTGGTAPDSIEYRRLYFIGDDSQLKKDWPAYTCALDRDTKAAFKACVCNK